MNWPIITIAVRLVTHLVFVDNKEWISKKLLYTKFQTRSSYFTFCEQVLLFATSYVTSH